MHHEILGGNRIIATLFTIFGIVAFILSAVGLYGVMSFSVNQRTQEFGIRMALGADAARIFRMVMTQGAWQLAIGLVLGAGGAALLLGVMAAAALQNILFKVNALDPSIYFAVAGLLTLGGRRSPALFRRAARRESTRLKRCATSDMNDLKFALRQLGKSPGFTFVAVLTLALGIGANTAIFSVVEGVLLRPLPFPHSERLVRIYEALDENGARSASLNLSDRTVARFRELGRDIFEDVAGGTGDAAVVGLNGSSPCEDGVGGASHLELLRCCRIIASTGTQVHCRRRIRQNSKRRNHQRRLLAQHVEFAPGRARQHDRGRRNAASRSSA